jgi:hypothetical protein
MVTVVWTGLLDSSRTVPEREAAGAVVVVARGSGVWA